jgi:MraZ protein
VSLNGKNHSKQFLMTGFLGEYEATLDQKGRFLLPGGLKKQFPDGENLFVITRGFEGNLSLYPTKTWETIIASISKLNDFDPKVRQFKTMFLGGATQVELDAAGRMLLPPSLKEYAGLIKDIIITPDTDKVKIWDASKYKKLFEDFSPTDFSSLANEVMVGKGNVEISN